PGAQHCQVERAVQLATRVSVNLEVPSARHLAALSSKKDFERELLAPARWIAELIDPAARRARTPPGQPARGARSQTTQFVVGATDETDREIIGRAAQLYRELGLARAYYSKFAPRPGTPLAERPPTSFLREHRLYQSDFLLRSYGFGVDEIPFTADGSLALDQDPKQHWAALHPERFPVEVNRAPVAELLRVPGIGPASAQRLARARAQQRLRSLDDLTALGVATRRAAPYLLLAGKRAASAQLSFAFAR
ncbi:MAG: helix-hairpin-helix domain-containing protein, partial [Deltaproteobacteria bacterium]|nr:helix-hairpin-helix domain-containing protein [Deltaproteobacteria bacterium]